MVVAQGSANGGRRESIGWMVRRDSYKLTADEHKFVVRYYEYMNKNGMIFFATT